MDPGDVPVDLPVGSPAGTIHKKWRGRQGSPSRAVPAGSPPVAFPDGFPVQFPATVEGPDADGRIGFSGLESHGHHQP